MTTTTTATVTTGEISDIVLDKVYLDIKYDASVLCSVPEEKLREALSTQML